LFTICSDMADGTTFAADPPDGAADGARLERQIALLGELAEAGLQIALAVQRRAQAAESAGEDLNPVAMAYARIARAVRLTVMLQARLIAERRDGEDARTAARAAAAFERREQKRRRVERMVERVAIDACGDDEALAEHLAVEAIERLEDDDLYGDVMSRPVGELVALICRDLGLEPDWAVLAEQAWARDEILGAAVGSPFVEAASETASETALGAADEAGSTGARLKGLPQTPI
jgi:hypothetical protein